jgi:hypothetical protein
MAALDASLERARQDGRGDGRADPSKLSKEELYELAKDADIPGRADMSKAELIEALGGRRPAGR